MSPSPKSPAFFSFSDSSYPDSKWLETAESNQNEIQCIHSFRDNLSKAGHHHVKDLRDRPPVESSFHKLLGYGFGNMIKIQACCKQPENSSLVGGTEMRYDSPVMPSNKVAQEAAEAQELLEVKEPIALGMRDKACPYEEGDLSIQPSSKEILSDDKFSASLAPVPHQAADQDKSCSSPLLPVPSQTDQGTSCSSPLIPGLSQSADQGFDSTSQLFKSATFAPLPVPVEELATLASDEHVSPSKAPPPPPVPFEKPVTLQVSASEASVSQKMEGEDWNFSIFEEGATGPKFARMNANEQRGVKHRGAGEPAPFLVDVDADADDPLETFREYLGQYLPWCSKLEKDKAARVTQTAGAPIVEAPILGGLNGVDEGPITPSAVKGSGKAQSVDTQEDQKGSVSTQVVAKPVPSQPGSSSTSKTEAKTLGLPAKSKRQSAAASVIGDSDTSHTIELGPLGKPKRGAAKKASSKKDVGKSVISSANLFGSGTHVSGVLGPLIAQQGGTAPPPKMPRDTAPQKPRTSSSSKARKANDSSSVISAASVQTSKSAAPKENTASVISPTSN